MGAWEMTERPRMIAERYLHELRAFPLQREAGDSQENLCFETLRRTREVISTPHLSRKEDRMPLKTSQKEFIALSFRYIILKWEAQPTEAVTAESRHPPQMTSL